MEQQGVLPFILHRLQPKQAWGIFGDEDSHGSCQGQQSLVVTLQGYQVRSLTQFYSVNFLQSRISVNKWVFNKRTIKVYISCFWRWRCSFFCSSRSNAQCKLRALEGYYMSSESPLRVRDGNEGVGGRDGREKCYPNEVSHWSACKNVPGCQMLFAFLFEATKYSGSSI